MSRPLDPSRSWQATCRHFFHHLNDVKELRRNPLAGRFFHATQTLADPDTVALEAIRSAIVEAFEEHNRVVLSSGDGDKYRRRKDILQAHILEGKEPDSVASQIHLSRSQFYREKQALCEYIAAKLAVDGKRKNTAASVSLQSHVVALSRARRLIEACETRRALELLDHVARTSDDVARKIEALCISADLLSAQLEHNAADLRLSSARRLLDEHAAQLDQQNARLCSMRIDFASVNLTLATGKGRQSKRPLRQLLKHLHNASSEDDETRQFYVDVLTYESERANANGDFRAFRAHLSAAQLLFATLSNRNAQQRARLVWLAGRMCNDPAANVTFADCMPMFTSAKELSEKEGLVATAVDSALDLATTLGNCLGDYAAGMTLARDLIRATLHIQDPVLIGKVCVGVANMRTMHHQFAEALQLLELARRRGKLTAWLDAMAQYTAADAYNGLRDLSRAKACADLAYKRATSIMNRRLQAAALRQSASTLHLCGDAIQARERIEEAVRLTEIAGNRASAAATFVVSAIITGNREHARIADDINRNVALLERRNFEGSGKMTRPEPLYRRG